MAWAASLLADPLGAQLSHNLAAAVAAAAVREAAVKEAMADEVGMEAPRVLEVLVSQVAAQSLIPAEAAVEAVREVRPSSLDLPEPVAPEAPVSSPSSGSKAARDRRGLRSHLCGNQADLRSKETCTRAGPRSWRRPMQYRVLASCLWTTRLPPRTCRPAHGMWTMSNFLATQRLADLSQRSHSWMGQN